MKEESIRIPGEEEYRDFMTGEAEPYLAKRRQVRYLERESGHRIYCEFYTCDACSPRGIVLISHGFTESAAKYGEVVWQFLKNGYHVCLPEHCGHARSYRLADEDPCLVFVDRFERYTADLAFTARAAEDEWPYLPLYLFAHSMGGGIGAALAAEEPDLFQKIILTSPMIRPATGAVPWRLAKLICAVCCASGKSRNYVMGQGPFQDNETFEESGSTSPARFFYYKERRSAVRAFQLAGASYGWLREAGRLDRFLMKKAYRQITCPVLLFQAESDGFVVKEEQTAFFEKLKGARPDPENVRFLPVAGTKHEIFNSTAEVLAGYWREIFAFLRGAESKGS